MNPDTTSTDTTSTDTTSTGSPVTITELAEFLRHLRTLSQPGAPDPTCDTTAERAAFLARKADLFARIIAQHPDLLQPSPTDGDPTDGDPT